MAERKMNRFTPFMKGQMVWLDARNLKLTITKRWLQNKKDHSKSRKSWDHSHTNWNYQTLGGFITSSMQPSLCHIWKQTYTDPILSDLPRTLRTTKNDTKWKRSSDT